ncbi:MAG: PIN domain-containing protein [Ignavibacteriaceae bacterium]|nr:PIN domain-containing protein [Ignavibacteriaceae bacterium]
MAFSDGHFFIESDIIIEHLIHSPDGTPSVLEELMQKSLCFTSAINASEMLFNSKNESEALSIKVILNALKVLGINSRYSLDVGFYREKVSSSRDALICSLVKSNKLTIVTFDEGKYSKTGLKVIIPLRK